MHTLTFKLIFQPGTRYPFCHTFPEARTDQEPLWLQRLTLPGSWFLEQSPPQTTNLSGSRLTTSQAGKARVRLAGSPG